MLTPSIDSLLTKVDSKYTLVTIAAKRAREIKLSNNQRVKKAVSLKNVGKALEEVDAGFLTYRNLSEDEIQQG